ncbi:alpha/beta fold hydrolase [Hypericibacter adhaerens]|nr:alpha/beta hydrolase [Hypericibacter adhaerens]
MASSSPMPSSRFEARQYSATDGLRLYYRAYGDPLAPSPVVVLCLPGITRNSKDFHDLASHLASQGRRILCPDYRGRGRSAYDPDWRHYRPEVYLEDLMQLLTLEGVERFVAIGTSMGGLLTMGLAVAKPAALAGVILNDIGPELETGGVSRIIDYIGQDHPQPDWAAAVAHLKATYPDLGLADERAWLNQAQATFREAADGLHVDWDVALARPLREGGPIRDLWPLFRAFDHRPLLVIRGGRSDVLSDGCLAKMIAAKPDLIHVTLPGVGHAPMLDEPAALEAIDGFFARLDRTRR